MTIWICFAYWQSSFARKTVCFERDKEALPPPRPCGPGCDPLRGSPLPVLGPLSFVIPPSFPSCRQFQPAAGNGLARRLIAATAKLRFSRNRRRMAASPGRSGNGRRVRLMPCVAVLSCRKFFLPSLLFMMIHSFFVAATAAEASATVAARSNLHPAGEAS